MSLLFTLNPLARGRTLLLACAILLGIATATPFAAPSDEPPSDVVGTIDGAAIAVSGPMHVDVNGGFTKTVLRSGSDVRVQSGVARLELVEGGTISICGPAHFSLLKSGGSLTVALDSGILHAHIERAPALTIYTAQIQARTIPIADGPQDVLMGFETPGAMCIRAERGAVRVEQQLTGQSIVIPQAGDVLLVNGQIDNLQTSTGHCACDLPVVRVTPPPPPIVPPPLPPETFQVAADQDRNKKPAETGPDPPLAAAEKPAAKEEPVYQVFMPPLVYDARATVQPEVDPRMMVLARRVRVRPALVFQGRVKGEMAAAPAPPPPQRSAAAPAPKGAAPPRESFIQRVWSFLRRLWSRGS